MRRVIFAFVLLVPIYCWGNHSDQESGFPEVQNYSPKDYHASNMNYIIARDSLGVLYSANEDGVLIFDGNTWELVPIKNNMPVYWVEIGLDGVVYVSSSSEFGYLKPSNGRLVYVSLSDQLDSQYRDFEVVWEIAATSRHVVFRSKKYLFVLANDQLSIVPSTGRGFDVAYTVRDTVYTNDWGVGLSQVVMEGVQVVKGGASLANTKLNIYLPYGHDDVLIGSRRNGMFLLSNGQITPFQTEADSIFYKYNIYHGCVTYDGNYALASSTSGLVIIDDQGHLIRFLDKEDGLPDNQILSVSALDGQNLWMATGMGLTKVGINSPLTYFDYKSGLKDLVTDIYRYDEELIISTLYGVYKLGSAPAIGALPQQVNLRSIQEVSAIDELDGKLVVGAQSGLMRHTDHGFERIVQRRETRQILVSADESKIYAAIGEGHFGVYFKKDEAWELVVLEDFIEPVKKILDFGSQVVIITGYGNLYLVNINEQDDSTRLEVQFVRHLGAFNATKYHDQLLVLTPAEAFVLGFDGTTSDHMDLEFAEEVSRIESVEVTPDDHIWVCFEDKRRINHCEQIYIKDRRIGLCNYKFKSDYRILTILPEQDGVTWFGGAGGLMRFDRNQINDRTDGSFVTTVGRLTLEDDSVLYSVVQPDTSLYFDEENLELNFYCSTNNSSDIDHTLYQFRLDGYDDNWSGWTPDYFKTYTNLDIGRYTFRARAKNSANVISKEARVQFEVKAPWHKTPYAYLLYLILTVLCIYLFVIWRVNAIHQINKKLEAKVLQRTSEVEHQKEVLRQANQTKDQLFSIIGHDLRSPLNTLQSLAELIQHYWDESRHDKVDELMGVMHRSVLMVRGLLDNLLTWTMNQSGQLNLAGTAIELRPFMEESIEVLAEAARSKDITIDLSVEVEATYIGDHNSLSVITRNLVSNAIKFTPAGGSVKLCANSTVDGLYLSVADTGIGIAPDMQKKIFELSSTSYGTANEKGTGIGLTLVQDFVVRNGGSIELHSEPGEGATFKVFLPALNH